MTSIDTVDITLDEICAQRKAITDRAKNRHPVRYEGQASPYSGTNRFSMFQLDMRRKAEILKYRASNTKSNNMTKAQLWSKISSSRNTQPAFTTTILQQIDEYGTLTQIIVKYPDTYTVTRRIVGNDRDQQPIYVTTYNVIPGRINTCYNDNLVRSTSSSSDVPGPAIDLYLDESVPLYNYGKTEPNYGILNKSFPDQYIVDILSDIHIRNIAYIYLMSIIIQDAIKTNFMNFSIQLPISIYFIATPLEDVTIPIVDNLNLRYNIIVDEFKLRVEYNESNVELQYPTTFTPVANFSKLSFNITSNKSVISGILYVGMLTISDLYLLTQPGYVYKINLLTILRNDTNSEYSSYFSSIETGILANASTPIMTQTDGVIIDSNLLTTTPYTGFSILPRP
jgi:hypothetical protein